MYIEMKKIHCQTYLTKVLWLSSACLTQSLKLRTLIRLSFNNATLTNNCIIMLLYYRFYHKKNEIRTSRTNCNLVKEYFCYLPPPRHSKNCQQNEKKGSEVQQLHEIISGLKKEKGGSLESIDYWRILIQNIPLQRQ